MSENTLSNLQLVDQNISTKEFLQELFSEDDIVNIRLIDDKHDCLPIKNDAFQLKYIDANMPKLLNLNTFGYNVSYVVNIGGTTMNEITQVTTQFMEADDSSIEDQLDLIKSCPLEPSCIIKTRKSLQTYWFLHKEATTIEQWIKIQNQLIHYFRADPKKKEQNTCMRLPGFNHQKTDETIPVRVMFWKPENRYTQEKIANAFPQVEMRIKTTTREKSVTEHTNKKGTELGIEKVLNECEFMKHCKDNAETLPEPLWFCMIGNLSCFADGSEAIHRLSSPYPNYTEWETNKKIKHAMDSPYGPQTCTYIESMGFECSKRKSGECSCMSPAALAFKMRNIDELKEIIGELPLANDSSKDAETAKTFINSYMYNIDPVEGTTLIREDLCRQLKLSNDVGSRLVKCYNKLQKEYTQGVTSRQRSYDENWPRWYQPTKNGVKILTGVLADFIMKNEHVFCLGEVLYRYDNGVYSAVDNRVIRQIIRSHIDSEFVTSHIIDDTLNQIKDLAYNDGSNLNSDYLMINFKNGLYHVGTQDLIDHTPSYLSTIRINANYNPSAECPRFMQFLTEFLPEDQIPVMQEIFGYLLVPTTRCQCMVIIHGSGGNGKSVCTSVLREILGISNISSVPLQDLPKRFQAYSTYGKLANICSDLPSEPLEDTGKIKELTGCDAVEFEPKGLKSFTGIPTARMVFSCNKVPACYVDRSEGMDRRYVIIETNPAIPKEQRDPNLNEKLFAELDGIVQWALVGLQRLIANNWKITLTERNQEALQRMQHESDYMLYFIEEFCIISAKHEIPSSLLYNTYKEQCFEDGVKAKGRPQFTLYLQDRYNIESKHTRSGNVLMGINLIERAYSAANEVFLGAGYLSASEEQLSSLI